jgi:cell division protein ZipA
VIASAANLLRPGSFDLQAMDVQDFPGLHVFAVLPGPLPPLQTYDELLSLARDLASRLGGELRDERGNTVDASTVEAQRLSLQDGGAGA